MLTDLELKEKFQLLSNKLKVGLFQEVIDEANARGISMLFTGHRLFRH